MAAAAPPCSTRDRGVHRAGERGPHLRPAEWSAARSFHSDVLKALDQPADHTGLRRTGDVWNGERQLVLGSRAKTDVIGAAVERSPCRISGEVVDREDLAVARRDERSAEGNRVWSRAASRGRAIGGWTCCRLRDDHRQPRASLLGPRHSKSHAWSPICARPPRSEGRVRGCCRTSRRMQSSERGSGAHKRGSAVANDEMQTTTRKLQSTNEELEPTNAETCSSTNARARRQQPRAGAQQRRAERLTFFQRTIIRNALVGV